MRAEVERVVGWDKVLDDARTTVGKGDLKKEPSNKFKRSILISEHSPIRNLMYEVTWYDIPYWVAMHLRTHQIGFKSGADDLIFVQTSRSDRINKDRDNMPQDAPVKMRVFVNAHSILNISRVRCCRAASPETVTAWQLMLKELEKVEPILAELAVPNCMYRGFCPEGDNTCKWNKSEAYALAMDKYREFVGVDV